MIRQGKSINSCIKRTAKYRFWAPFKYRFWDGPYRTQILHVKSGLDTNGCPLGNSKFTLLSDNLNICQWLSACQVEKIYQNQIQIDTNVDNPTSDLDVIYDFNQFNPNCFWFILKTKWFCWKALFTPVLDVVKSVFPQLATTLSGDTTIILGIVCKVLFSCLFPKTQNDKAVRLPKMRWMRQSKLYY